MLSQVVLLALASSAFALQITSPGENTVWDLSKTNEIKWNAVNTDPQTFDIYLSHMAAHPPSNTLLSANQNKDAGSFTVKDLQLPVGTTYQINFVAHDKPEQIYAQSAQFNTTGEAIAATSTLDGYTGPTYVPSGSSGAAQSTATTGSVTRSSGTTRTTLSTETTTSGSATLTRTTSATITEGASSGAANATNSNAGSASTPRPTQTNAAVVGNGASAPLAALVFGAVAFFL